MYLIFPFLFRDLYAALRDCQTALNIDSDYMKAHYRLVRCLYDLHWIKEAFDCLISFKTKFPDHAHTDSCNSLDRDIHKALYSKSDSSNHPNETSTGTSQSTVNSDTIRQLIGESANNASTNLINNMSNYLTNQEKEWRSQSFDYKSRFCGHCNTTTDIKEANFFGRYHSIDMGYF